MKRKRPAKNLKPDDRKHQRAIYQHIEQLGAMPAATPEWIDGLTALGPIDGGDFWHCIADDANNCWFEIRPFPSSPTTTWMTLRLWDKQRATVKIPIDKAEYDSLHAASSEWLNSQGDRWNTFPDGGAFWGINRKVRAHSDACRRCDQVADLMTAARVAMARDQKAEAVKILHGINNVLEEWKSIQKG